MIDLLKKNGPFFKANLHTHTTVSDGRMTPEQRRDWYRSHGYSILSITDHSKYHQYPELCTDDFLMVPGVEATKLICPDPKNPKLKYHLCHINFWPKDPATAVYEPEPEVYDIGTINAYIARMKKNGWLCSLNHPGWSFMETSDVNQIRGVDGFEVYNHISQYLDNNGDGQTYYSMFLKSGNFAYAMATDDAHCGYNENGEVDASMDMGGGWIMISMPKLGHAEFIDAFENGRFYASTGPEIKELYIDEERDVLVVECSPVHVISLKGIHTVRAKRIIGYGDELTHAEFPLAEVREKEPFIRLELLTEGGKRAYGQPYYFE
ncbi:MAG: PHP domain-containing protein [Lachnospiraceae bacterium]|nr:PHP domain-containing protein [Lachnospiraceae bacterium]